MSCVLLPTAAVTVASISVGESGAVSVTVAFPEASVIAEEADSLPCVVLKFTLTLAAAEPLLVRVAVMSAVPLNLEERFLSGFFAMLI